MLIIRGVRRVAEKRGLIDPRDGDQPDGRRRRGRLLRRVAKELPCGSTDP